MQSVNFSCQYLNIPAHDLVASISIAKRFLPTISVVCTAKLMIATKMKLKANESF